MPQPDDLSRAGSPLELLAAAACRLPVAAAANYAAPLELVAAATHMLDCELPRAEVIEGPLPQLTVRIHDSWEAAPTPPLAREAAAMPARAAADRRADDTASRGTRLRPPRDVVKLGERLSYLLQPPLEELLNSASLDCPFDPFPHQFEGVAFLYTRHEAILADEMGLGKTMQATVALRLLAHHGQLQRVLLICPKPLMTNWKRELSLWAPELPVAVLAGDTAERQWIWRRNFAGVLLANYELVARDREIVGELEQPFDAVLVDEAQRIKNRSSVTNQAVCAIPRRRSWALTGTPIENSPDDLAGIFGFVAAGRVRPKMSVTAMRRAVSDHVIRRTKEQVLTDLPPKLMRDAEVELTPEQADAYRRAEEAGVVQLDSLGSQLTIQHVFELVLRLKQICNFEPVSGASAKLERLSADLEECVASGRKAIVFSQWVATIRQLAEALAPYRPLEYHGKIPSARRDQVIEEFRDDPTRHVLLMSYGAGSVGLNLQFSQYVFLFDRWWNPAVEDQAINRAHRIGAAGPVTVTRFLTLGTIEQRIDRVLSEKREIFQSIFDDGIQQSAGMSRDEVFSLFPLRVPGRSD